MKRLYTRIRIFLIALSLGLACVPFVDWTFDEWSELAIELPQIKSDASLLVFPVRRQETRTGGSGPSGSLLDGIQETGRGCGNGYAQGYKLPNGKKISEGNNCYSSFDEAIKEMRDWLARADQVIEQVSPLNKVAHKKSERVVATFPVDEYGNKWVTVMWVDDECIHWINAPDFEHALEFERNEFNPYKFEE